MFHSQDVQAAGSLAVASAILGSEVAPRYLDACPDCAFAWYLNLEVLGPFRDAQLDSSPLRFLFGSGTLAGAAAVMGAIVLFRLLRFRFGLALCANGAFGVAAALGWNSGMFAAGWRTASLGAASSHAVDGGGVLLAGLLVASLAACGLSHASFAALIAAERSERRSR